MWWLSASRLWRGLFDRVAAVAAVLRDHGAAVRGGVRRLARRCGGTLRPEPLPPRPLVVVAVALAAGCVAGPFIPLPCTATLVACWLAAAACVGGWAVLLRGDRPSPAALLLACGLLLAGAAWSRARLELFARDEIAWQLGTGPTPVAVRGTVLESPRPLAAPAGDDRRAAAGPATGWTVAITAVRVKSRWQPADGRASVIVAADPVDLPAGTVVRILGRGLRPSGPLNPGEADAAVRARAARCLSIIRVSDWSHVRVVGRAAWWWPSTAIDRLRARAAAVLAERIAPTRAALATALLLGQRDALPRATADAFVVTGTIHILAISGLHVGLLAAGLFAACRWACLSRRWAAVVVAAVIGGYMVLVGGGTPVVRATILVWIACGAVAVGRQPATVNSLAAAAVVVLLWRPAEVFSAGAQLSFLSTGILVGVGHVLRQPREFDPIDRLIERSRPWWEKGVRRAGGWVGCGAVASAAVWLATAPLVASRFHVVSLVGLVLNVLVAAVVPVAMGCGFLCLVTAPVSGTVAGVFAAGCDGALAVIELLVSGAAAVPGGHGWVAGPPGWWVAGWYAILAAALGCLRPDLLRRTATWATLAAGWSLVGLGIAWAGDRPAAPGLRVVVAAVGHGCGIVVRSPTGRCLLYDAGRLGAAGAARRSLSAVLWSERIGRIDTLVISHADTDHFNAVPDLLARFRVGEILVPEPLLASRSASVADLLAAAAERGVPVRPARAGDAFAIDPLCRARVLHPGPDAAADAGSAVTARTPVPRLAPGASRPATQADAGRPDNEASLVLAIEAAGRRLLLTGDLEGPALRDFVAAGPGGCDVLVAPHHGTRTSLPADIARATAPEVVLVSGRGGRSWPEVQAAYATAAGRPAEAVLHTGDTGAIAVTLAAGGLSVERFTAGRWRPVPPPHDPPGGPCQSSGVGNRAKPERGSEVSFERVDGRMPFASVRRDGTGHPGPPERPRIMGDPAQAAAVPVPVTGDFVRTAPAATSTNWLATYAPSSRSTPLVNP